ncbi:chromatin modification-related protein eaf-1-like isoform X1 [Musa acuminata AAA Group]|uniref:chromatin modification-related protein eaf-1-like isoform X1 n=1 Tax=Musa acuminata AAA Group TaxID=214697 RepID=UPI0031DF74E6
MGFDNECILNIQTLPGEYFCPVCRTLIYPNEALQSQCTHLYCKPCLAYIVATSQACPYDGYLVTEADSKPLIESNKALAETIGKVAVYCLYCRSGCQWQGTLSECIAHCTGCAFGNSPVVCNRCGIQIIHRQVQEHTQICPGLQPQAQQVDGGQAQASTTSSQAVSQDPSVASSAAPASTASAASATTTSAAVATPAASAATPTALPAATSVIMPVVSTTATTLPAASQGQSQTNSTGNAQAAAQVPTPQQLYQQQQLQYQQYYQMYHGYDPYQQQYQQNAQYQQQPYPQYAQSQMQVVPQLAIQGQQQTSSYVQSQPHPQAQLQPQALAQPLTQPQPQPQAQVAQLQQQQQHLPQPQPQPQPQSQPSAHLVQMQTQLPRTPVQQPYTQARPQTNLPPQAQIAGQQFGQPPQPHQTQQSYPRTQPQQQVQAPLYQQPLQPHHHPQSLPQQLPHLHAQPQARPTSLQQPPMLLQPHPQHPSAQPQPMTQPQHPSVHAVTERQSYQQPQMLQQDQPGAQPQHPMLMHSQQQGVTQQHPVQLPNQFAPQQPPRMPPPTGHIPMQVQQQPMLPTQRPPASLQPQQQPHLTVHQHGQQLHQYTGLHSQAPQQGLPPQQSHGHLNSGQQSQLGMLASQQQLHPQVPPYTQHHFPPHLQPQQSMPLSQALTTHQTQAVAGRPVMVNNGMPHQLIQQSPRGPGKLVQHVLNQQSPSQSHLTQPGNNLAAAYDSQRSHLPKPGSYDSSIPVSASHSGVVDKVGHATELSTETAAKNAEGNEQTERSAMVDPKILKTELETVKEKVSGKVKEKDMQLEVEPTLVRGRSMDSHTDMELPESKHAIKEELANLPEDGIETSHISKDRDVEGEIQGVEEKPDVNAGVQVEIQCANLPSDASLHSISSALPKESSSLSEGQTDGEIASKTQPPQQLSVTSSDGGQLPQPTKQRVTPSYDGASLQPGSHEKNSAWLAWQGLGSGMPQVVGPAGSSSDKEGFPPQHIPHSHPSNVPVMTPRFPAPDKILPLQMSHQGAIHDRRSQEAPYQMQAPGQNMILSQMRPLDHGYPEPIPRQVQPSIVQEPLRPPSGQPYGGGYHSDAMHGGLPGPVLPTSGRAPGHAGFPQQGFPEPVIAQGQSQNYLSVPHAGTTRVPHGESLTRTAPVVPLTGAFNTSTQMMPRGPPFHPEDRGVPSHVGNPNILEAEIYDTRRPVFQDVRQTDPHVESNVIANGIQRKLRFVGMHDSHGLAEGRLKPLPDERFRSLPGDGMPRPFPLEPGRHNVSGREFEEDLKQFPRPAHLDGEGFQKFDSYGSSTRLLERGQQHVGPDSIPRSSIISVPGPDGIPSEFLATQVGPFQAGNSAPFPASRAGSEFHMMNILEMRRPAGFHEDFGAVPDLRRSLPGSGHRHIQSPVKNLGGLPSSRFGSASQPHMEDIDPKELHGFAERSKAFNLPSDSTGSYFHDSKSSMPGALHGRSARGVPDRPRNFRMVEQLHSGNFPGSTRKDLDGREIPRIHMHPGEPFDWGHFPTGDRSFGVNYGHDFPNEAGMFSTKRKPGTTGWCRICSVDCGTVEGLDFHAQSREHQRMAIDMVLAIKKENNKKHRISEGVLSFEDSNKSRNYFGRQLK